MKSLVPLTAGLWAFAFAASAIAADGPADPGVAAEAAVPAPAPETAPAPAVPSALKPGPIMSLDAAFVEVRSAYAQIELRLTEKERELRKVIASQQAAQLRAEQLETQLKESQADRAKLKADVDRLRKQVDEAQEAIAGLLNTLTSLEEQLSTTQQENRRLTQEKSMLDATSKGAAERLKQLEEERDRARDMLADVQRKLHGLLNDTGSSPPEPAAEPPAAAPVARKSVPPPPADMPDLGPNLAPAIDDRAAAKEIVLTVEPHPAAPVAPRATPPIPQPVLGLKPATSTVTLAVNEPVAPRIEPGVSAPPAAATKPPPPRKAAAPREVQEPLPPPPLPTIAETEASTKPAAAPMPAGPEPAIAEPAELPAPAGPVAVKPAAPKPATPKPAAPRAVTTKPAPKPTTPDSDTVGEPALAAEPAAVPAPAPAPKPAPAAKAGDRTDLLARASATLEAGKFKEARELYDEALRAKPDDRVAMRGLAESMLAGGETAAAEKLVIKLLGLDGKNAGYLFLAGRIASATGRYQEATVHLENALQDAPDDPAIRRELATVYYGLNRLVDAADMFRSVLKLDPNDGESHFNLAAVLLMSDPPWQAEAATHYREALRLGEPRDESIEKLLPR